MKASEDIIIKEITFDTLEELCLFISNVFDSIPDGYYIDDIDPVIIMDLVDVSTLGQKDKILNAIKMKCRIKYKSKII